MYLVFAGTTDYIKELKLYLSTIDHTLLEGSASWMNAPLDAQVVILFDEDAALKLRNFLVNECHQASVPVHFIPTIQI